MCAAASKFSARYDNNAFDLRIGRVAERQRNLFVTLNDSVFNYVSLTSNIYAAELGNSELYGLSVHTPSIAEIICVKNVGAIVVCGFFMK